MLYCKPFLEHQKRENHNILIIEDSLPICKALTFEFRKYENYSVSVAMTFAEAQEHLQESTFDVIILDLHLPDVYGEELVEEVQRLSDAKIIVVTSEMDIQIRESLFKKKILDYIVKDKTFSYTIKSIDPIIKSIEKNRNSTVLVIDDSRFMCRQLRTFLEVRNYQVITVLDAASGFEALQGHEINTIILDMELPDIHGLDFLRRLKAIEEFCHIPVVVLSGTNDPETVRQALKAGASDFVQKPFNVEEVMLKVDLSVESNRQYTRALCMQRTLQEYKNAIDSSSLVSKTDTKGIITYANKAFCDISGYSAAELIGSPHSIVRHPDVPSSVFKEMWETILAKKTWEGKLKNRKKNGRSYYVKTTISPILDANDTIIEFVAIRTDITQEEIYRQLLEKDLQIANNSTHYLSQIENAMQRFVAVMKTDRSGKIISANDNFLNIIGYELDELLTKKYDMLCAQKHILQRDCERVEQELDEGKIVKQLFENIKKDGSSLYIDATIHPLYDHNNEVREYLHLMYDVSDLIEIYDELEQTQKDIIYTMGEIGESRSQEMGNHVKRVAEYTKLLALLAGESEEHAQLLFGASPMHDIGKVAIPDAILNKPGRHNEEEFAIMKRHSEIGYEVLKNSNRKILQTAAMIAYTHHERYDGNGYPRGLRGDDIPLCGRITAIADVFDALGSDRVYKKAWPLEKVLEFFKEERGKHFDPHLIDLFFEHLDKFLEIRDKFKDH